MNKIEVMERVENMIKLARYHKGESGYIFELVIKEWVKNGHDRTYIAVVETRQNSKLYRKHEIGYYDNAKDEFVEKKDLDYTLSGANYEADLKTYGEKAGIK